MKEMSAQLVEPSKTSFPRNGSKTDFTVANILQISRVAFFGGVERMIVNIVRATASGEFSATVAVPEAGELSKVAQSYQIQTTLLPISRGKAPRTPIELVMTLRGFFRGRNAMCQFVRDCGISLIHTHHPVTAIQAIKAKKKLSVPLILHVHETLPVARSYAAAMKSIVGDVDHFICVSQASYNLVSSFGAPADRISLVYNGLDDLAFAHHDPATDIEGPGPHIGIFGVIEPRKGQDVFLDACRDIAVQHPTSQFWIVGAVSFSDKEHYAASLRAIASVPELRNKVHFTGHRSDVPALMMAMDVVVSASTGFESLPTVLLEASALGRPIVATDVGGVREIIDDGRTGLIVPPHDAGALSTAIGSILGKRGADFGKAARRNAMERFSLDRFALEICGIYRRLLKMRG